MKRLTNKKFYILWPLLTLVSLGNAHWADLATASINIAKQEVRLMLTFPSELITSQLDATKLNNPSEVTKFFNHYIVLADKQGRALTSFSGLIKTNETHITASLNYNWPEPINEIKMHYGLFLPQAPNASMLATITEGEKVRSLTFTPESREAIIAGHKSLLAEQVKSFATLGVEHILTGYDHLLFLLALLMLGSRIGYLLKVVTAFTVAHSLTLSLAVLGLVNLPVQLVESAIALSIVFVAIENLWCKEKALKLRWLIVFIFGLLHGLGFAGILQEMPIPRSELAISLLSFNLGVEIGQITAVAVVFVLLQAIKKQPWEVYLRRWASASVAVMGILWLVERTFPIFKG